MTAENLSSMAVGDEIDTGMPVFANCTEEAVALHLTKANAQKGMYFFDITYLGIMIGRLLAKVQGEDVLWIDPNDPGRKL